MFKRCGLIFLVLPFIVQLSSCVLRKDRFEDIDLTIFHDKAIDKFEEQVDILDVAKYQQFWTRLGKIAFFIRMTRRFAKSPNVGSVDFEHYFPKPELPFHHELYTECKTNIWNCVNFTFNNIQLRALSLFPTNKTNAVDDFTISAENFNRLITNNRFQFDVSIAQLFCFLSKNKFKPLERLPFCTYANENLTKNVWPADRYKELKEHNELFPRVGEELEAFDESMSYGEFQCAELSFCPNPCCGFNSDKASCSHPICEKANPKKSCSIKEDLNLDLLGMIANVWNISCGCDQPGHVYRFDVEKCVDSDECFSKERDDNGVEKKRCPADKHEECVNTVGSFECVCKMGYVRDPTTKLCLLVQLGSFEFNGPALDFNSHYIN